LSPQPESRTRQAEKWRLPGPPPHPPVLNEVSAFEPVPEPAATKALAAMGLSVSNAVLLKDLGI
jgi:hypothetical protein